MKRLPYVANLTLTLKYIPYRPWNKQLSFDKWGAADGTQCNQFDAAVQSINVLVFIPYVTEWLHNCNLRV